MTVASRTAAAVVLAGTAAAVLLGAGTASAIGAPDIDLAGGYAGVELNHAETVALAQSPLPGLINQLPHKQIWVLFAPGGDPSAHHSVQGIVGEAAAHPDGRVHLSLTDPAKWDGCYLAVLQHWH